MNSPSPTGYLLYTLDLGSPPLHLYGGLKVSGDEADFVLGSAMPFDVSGLLPGPPTTEIVNPLGLRGVTLKELQASGRVYKASGSTQVDLAIAARATFPSLPRFGLAGALVVADGSARLVFVQLTASPPLSLTDFLTGVAGSALSFGAPVTDQFVFQDAVLYWLQAPPGSPLPYRWPYTVPGETDARTFTDGYHLVGHFSVFGWPFQIAVDVTERQVGGVPVRETVLSTTSQRDVPILPDFIRLQSARVEFASRQSKADSYLRVGTTVNLFQEDVAEVIASYDEGKQAFTVTVDKDLGSLSIPGGGSQPVHLFVSLEWSSAHGCRIVAISGLPTRALDLIEELFAQLQSGGCQALVKDWLSGLGTTSLKPGLRQGQSPAKQDDGNLRVPLKLDYALVIGSTPQFPASIPFDAVFALPTRLSDFPIKLCESLVLSGASIVTTMLRDPQTYQVIALEVARRGGASALARMICRALERGLIDTARALADAAGAAAAETIAAAAELAAAVVSVALFGVSLLKSFFDRIWQEILDLFRKHDTSAVDAKLGDIRKQVNAAAKVIDDRVGQVQALIVPTQLRTSLDSAAVVWTNLTWNKQPQEPGSNLVCQLQFLTGDAGRTDGTTLLNLDDAVLPDHRAFRDISADYRMNARLRTRLTGIRFMTPADRKQITDAQDTLRSLNYDPATRLANTEVQALLNRFDDLNSEGVKSGWIYANTDIEQGMTIDRSIIGLNTRFTS